MDRRLKVTATLALHPSVLRVARAMQAKLDRDVAKGSWLETDLGDLVHGIFDETVELTRAKHDWHNEAADVANFAMMYADAAEVLAQKEAAP